MQKPAIFWKSQYKLGQIVQCQILARGVGGYTVRICRDNRIAFLESLPTMTCGQEVLARVQGSDKRGVILHAELADADRNRQTDPNPGRAQAQAQTQTVLQVVPPSCRRAIDLIPQPPPAVPVEQLNTKELEIEQIICLIEGGMRTACIKGYSEERRSRYLILSLRGRLVGCTYGRRGLAESGALSMNDAVRLALSDLSSRSDAAVLYDVPEYLMEALASLYLGEPIHVPRGDALAQYKLLNAYFCENEMTGCIVACSEQGESLNFTYRCSGHLAGTFDVRSQKFAPQVDSPLELTSQTPSIILKASSIHDARTRMIGVSLSLSTKTAQ